MTLDRVELAIQAARADTGLVVLGTSGHAREIIAIAQAAGRHQVLGCIGPPPSSDIRPLPVRWLGTDDWFVTSAVEAKFVIGIGSGRMRALLDQRLSYCNREAASLVHPAATVGPAVDLGPGSVIWPGAVLTTDVVAGRHVHVNVNVAVGHDVVL